jgi:hypothetical protein
MTDLSPAAQAVLDALHTNNSTGPERFWARANAAAAIRAATDQVVLDEKHPGPSQFWDHEANQEWQTNQAFRRKLLAIAAELEALPND